MKEKLSEKERKRFEICKQQIDTWLQSGFDTGIALTEIKQGKLYREEFDTFEFFCQQTYQIGRAHAYRLIAAASVKMSPVGDKIQNEAQARAIAQVPEKDRKAVLKIAEKSGDLTAAAIAEAADKVEQKKESAPSKKPEIQEAIELDATGFPIPHACIEYWRRTGEIQELLTAVSRIKSTLEKKRAEDDVLYRNISQAVVNELALAYSFIANAKPYAVCLNCQGKLKDSCRGCKGTGFMAKFAYEHEQVKGLRVMREAVMAKGKK